MPTINTSQAEFLAILLSLSSSIIKNDANVAEAVAKLNILTKDDVVKIANVVDTITNFIYTDSKSSKDALNAAVNSLDCFAEDRDSFLLLIQGYALSPGPDRDELPSFVTRVLNTDKVYTYQVYSLIVRYSILTHDSTLIEQAINKIQSIESNKTTGGQ